jgi:RNA polymerase sigma factor (sigma-70 family)
MTASPSGDRVALTALLETAYRKYFRIWINNALSAHVSEDEAKDIVHSVICTVLTMDAEKFESVEHIRNYISRGVINRAWQAKKRGDRRVSWGEAAEIRFPTQFDPGDSEAKVERAAFREAIRGLSDRDFEIVKLKYFMKLTFLEISDLLGVPISTLKSREVAALKRINRELRKKGWSGVIG